MLQRRVARGELTPPSCFDCETARATLALRVDCERDGVIVRSATFLLCGDCSVPAAHEAATLPPEFVVVLSALAPEGWTKQQLTECGTGCGCETSECLYGSPDLALIDGEDTDR